MSIKTYKSVSPASLDEVTYDRKNPFFAPITRRYRLNKIGSCKETWHVELDLSGSDIAYRPGDSIGILPENDPEVVAKILHRIGPASGLEEFLQKRANLQAPTKKLIQYLVDQGESAFSHLLIDTSRDLLKQFCMENSVLELLEKCHAIIDPEQFMTLLSPLLPRFYSISSSRSRVGNEVHLTISHVQYEVAGKKRVGLCSNYLCRQVSMGAPVALYLQKTRDFLLPEVPAPIIMVGPGTGIAPFRAFMHEREEARVKDNWLFFGETTKAHDFFYEEYWNELLDRGLLRLDTAFSRDQEEKVYVQHKMWEKRKELNAWLDNGAYLYVCGDASRMAKDVEQTLIEIFMTEGNLDDTAAKNKIKELRREKRYLRDVY